MVLFRMNANARRRGSCIWRRLVNRPGDAGAAKGRRGPVMTERRCLARAGDMRGAGITGITARVMVGGMAAEVGITAALEFMHPAGTEAADPVDLGVGDIRVAGVMAAAAVGTADIEKRALAARRLRGIQVLHFDGGYAGVSTLGSKREKRWANMGIIDTEMISRGL